MPKWQARNPKKSDPVKNELGGLRIGIYIYGHERNGVELEVGSTGVLTFRYEIRSVY